MRLALGGLDFVHAWSEVLRIVHDPWSNTTSFLLLLGVIIVAVFIVATIIVGIVSAVTSRPHTSEELETLLAYLAVLEGTDVDAVRRSHELSAPPPPPLRERLRTGVQVAAMWLAVGTVALLVLTVALGVSTSTPQVCAACHVTTPHAKAVKSGVKDPHQAVSCVDCHESSGLLGRLVIDVPARLRHFATGWQPGAKPAVYGTTTSPACLGCHGSVTSGVTTDTVRGIRMVHTQPLQAGAECRTCHTIGNGVVSTLTVGMAPCLRCHDGTKQSTRCETCHTKDVSVATRSHVDPAAMTGRALMPTPDCSACHDMVKQCDPCHAGVRMPHSQLFMAWGHARKAAQDVWFNGGQACARCHTSTRRPCGKCHIFLPTAGHGTSWAKDHQLAKSAVACDSCHGQWKGQPGRDFCKLCHGIRVDQ